MAEGGITGKGFVKGDPRINRKGRPKSFDALRARAIEISAAYCAVAIQRWADMTGQEPQLLVGAA